MHGQQAMAADGVGRSTGGRRVLVRALVLAASLALVAQGMVQPAGAEDTDVGGAGQANVQVCEAAGGTAEVKQWQYGNGSQFVAVECNGGYLDGWDCYHSTQTGTWQCSATIIVPDDGKAPTGALRIDPMANGGGTESPAALAGGSTSTNAQLSMVAPDHEQHQDHSTAPKGKGKHGKQRGKHHK